MIFEEKQIIKNTVYNGRLVNVRSDTAEITGGKHVSREVVEHPGGVCIVPIDRDGMVYCVRQFRYPFMEELLELPAGKLEWGEEPAGCASRELSEETGLIAGRMTYLGSIYPSPGYCSEILHIYLATDLTQSEPHLDPDEFLQVETLKVADLLALIDRDEVRDAKTIIGLLRGLRYLNEDSLLN